MKYQMEIKPKNSKGLVTQQQDELFEAYQILGEQLEVFYNKTTFLKLFHHLCNDEFL